MISVGQIKTNSKLNNSEDSSASSSPNSSLSLSTMSSYTKTILNETNMAQEGNESKAKTGSFRIDDLLIRSNQVRKTSDKSDEKHSNRSHLLEFYSAKIESTEEESKKCGSMNKEVNSGLNVNGTVLSNRQASQQQNHLMNALSSMYDFSPYFPSMNLLVNKNLPILANQALKPELMPFLYNSKHEK